MPDADSCQIGKSIWLTQKIQPYREMQMKPIFGTRAMETKLSREIYRDLTRQCEFRSPFLKNLINWTKYQDIFSIIKFGAK